MTSVIESDLIFPKTATQTGRKDRASSNGESGEAFARTLQQSEETAKHASARPPEAQTSGTAQAVLTIPLLPAESEADSETSEKETQAAGDILPSATDMPPEAEDAQALVASALDTEIPAPGLEAADTSDDAANVDVIPLAVGAPPPQDTATSVVVEDPEILTADLSGTTQAVSSSTPDKTDARTDVAAQAAPPSPDVQSDSQLLAARATVADASPQSRTRTIGTAQNLKTSTSEPVTALSGVTDAASPSEIASLSAKTVASETATAETPLFPDAEPPSDISDLDSGSSTSKTKASASTAPVLDGATMLASAALPAQAQTPQASQPKLQMTPTNALVTASPADTVKIISDAVASPDDTPDRITVQLDPPELGRVSIDFKFDAHGLQHVTVTGETPEAMRQLRLMHFELTQALERGGLSSQNMTFQQQQSGHQQAQTPAPARLFEANGTADTSLLAPTATAAETLRPARTAGGGLDIRL